MDFREFLGLNEETTAGDIATVDSRVGDPAKKIGKKCKKHDVRDCAECFGNDPKDSSD